MRLPFFLGLHCYSPVAVQTIIGSFKQTFFARIADPSYNNNLDSAAVNGVYCRDEGEAVSLLLLSLVDYFIHY